MQSGYTVKRYSDLPKTITLTRRSHFSIEVLPIAHIVLVEENEKQIGIWVLSFDQPSATDILGFPMTRLGPKLKCPTAGQGGLYRPRKKLSEENAAG